MIKDLKGFYRAYYDFNDHKGDGVVCLSEGAFLGVDAGFEWRGVYLAEGDDLTADMNIIEWNKAAKMHSIFGNHDLVDLYQYGVKFVGRSIDDSIVGEICNSHGKIGTLVLRRLP